MVLNLTLYLHALSTTVCMISFRKVFVHKQDMFIPTPYMHTVTNAT